MINVNNTIFCVIIKILINNNNNDHGDKKD